MEGRSAHRAGAMQRVVKTAESLLTVAVALATLTTVCRYMVHAGKTTCLGRRLGGEGGGVRELLPTRSPAPRASAPDYGALGVGGLRRQYETLVRRVLLSRMVPERVVRELGLQHVRGILLHGPPGTGKTLLARRIGEMLRCRSVRMIAAPEVLSKYHGQSEANLRALFDEARRDHEAHGARAGLHLVVIDEVDSLCSARQSARAAGAGAQNATVHNDLVNQLLALLDGIDELPNVLIVGTTNRLADIDPAALRPGRFEVKVRVGLPDAAGRLEILRVHTRAMRASGRLAPDVRLPEVAGAARGYTGAELAGVVRSAASRALRRVAAGADGPDAAVTADDVRAALREVRPMHAAASARACRAVPPDELLRCFASGGIALHSDAFRASLARCVRLLAPGVAAAPATAAANRDGGPVRPRTLLLIGAAAGCGKTALSAYLAHALFACSGIPVLECVAAGKPCDPAAAIGACFRRAARRAGGACVLLDDVDALLDGYCAGAAPGPMEALARRAAAESALVFWLRAAASRSRWRRACAGHVDRDDDKHRSPDDTENNADNDDDANDNDSEAEADTDDDDVCKVRVGCARESEPCPAAVIATSAYALPERVRRAFALVERLAPLPPSKSHSQSQSQSRQQPRSTTKALVPCA